MKQIMIKMLALIMAFLVFSEVSLTGHATSVQTQQQIDNLKEEQEETQEELDEAEKKKANLEASKKKLENYLIELNNQFIKLSEELMELESQLEAKKKELHLTGEELDKAKEVEAKQYADMKKRIQFLYENGNMDYFTMFFEADSFGDFLNRAEYASELAAYDRRMLTMFQETKRQIEEQETLLKEEKNELEDIQSQVTQKQEEVSSLVQTTGTKINQYASEIAAAQAEVNAIEGELAEQQSALDQLIAKAKAEEEEALRKQQAQSGSGTNFTGGTSNNGAVSASGSDLDMLAAIIHCEASGEGYEGQLAVGAVIMNRVRSGKFPNSIMGVIYQGGQFSPVASGRFIIALSQGSASASCRQAAQDAVKGKSNIGGCLYFRRNNGSVNGYVLGNHVFY